MAPVMRMAILTSVYSVGSVISGMVRWALCAASAVISPHSRISGVTEELLSVADYMGIISGKNPDKMKIDLDIGKGAVLDVPVLNNSPVNFELEVTDFIEKHDGTVMLCKIRNVLQDESLSSDETAEQKLMRIAPVKTTCKHYFSYQGKDLGAWGEPMKRLK